MENSARKLRIALPKSERKNPGALLEELSAQVDSPNQFLYWQITRGAGPRNHLFPRGGGGQPVRPLRQALGPRCRWPTTTG